MPQGFQMNISEKTTRFLKQKTTGVLLCAALLAGLCLALFTTIARQLAATFKKAVNFV